MNIRRLRLCGRIFLLGLAALGMTACPMPQDGRESGDGRLLHINRFGHYPFAGGFICVSQAPKGILYFAYVDKNGGITASSAELAEKMNCHASLYHRWNIVLFKDTLWLDSSDMGLYRLKISGNKNIEGFGPRDVLDVPEEVFECFSESTQRSIKENAAPKGGPAE